MRASAAANPFLASKTRRCSRAPASSPMTRRFPDRRACSSCARRTRTRASTAIETKAAAALPGVIAIVTGDDLVRAGVKPLPLSADFKRADGSPTASAPRHALAVGTVRFVGEAVAAVVAHNLAQARDAIEAIDVGYDAAAERRRRRRRRCARRAAAVPGGDRQHRRGDPPRRPGGDRCCVREGRARRQARPRQPAAGGLPDRAARDPRQLRHGDRAHYAARFQPDTHGAARRALHRRAGHSQRQGPRAGRRRRRRLRHEDRPLSRRRRTGVLRA